MSPTTYSKSSANFSSSDTHSGKNSIYDQQDVFQLSFYYFTYLCAWFFGVSTWFLVVSLDKQWQSHIFPKSVLFLENLKVNLFICSLPKFWIQLSILCFSMYVCGQSVFDVTHLRLYWVAESNIIHGLK